MLDIERSPQASQPSSLSQWLYQAIQEPGVRLRIRLRGNNLHVLCEGSQTPELDRLLPRLTGTLRTQSASFHRFFRNTEEPIYKIILYGRQIGTQRPDWIESIVLDRLPPSPSSPPTPQLPISNEDLARSGTPEAIARYLSESLSHLGVAVKVLIQKLPEEGDLRSLKRLWVICSCHYSPDASLIAEPIAQQLRDLELEGFKEAIIRAQVRGEESPDWMLQVDLTRRSIMLREWGRWGDVKSLQCLLDNALDGHNIKIGTVLKEKTLHIFSSWREEFLSSDPVVESSRGVAPSREEVIAAISPILDELAPQGIETAEIYGMKTPEMGGFSYNNAALLDLEELNDRGFDSALPPQVWTHRLELPAAKNPNLSLSVFALARQKHVEALTFLFQRLLNPDIEGRLATGGIRVKLCFKDRLLHVMTEAVVCPRQTLVANKIETLLNDLNIEDLAGARIYGRRSGQSSPLWSYGIDFADSGCLSKEQRQQLTNKEKSQLFFPISSSSDLSGVAEVAIASPTWQIWRNRFQSLLKATQLFVSSPDRGENSAIARSPHSYPQQPRLAFPVTAIWLAIGCFFAVQVDGGLTRWLARQDESIELTKNHKGSRNRENLSLATNIWKEDPSQNTDDMQAQAEIDASEERQAQKAAMLAVARLSANLSFNNTLLDEKIALYRERVKRWGAPDILIVGSSRALRGIDPTILQKELTSFSHLLTITDRSPSLADAPLSKSQPSSPADTPLSKKSGGEGTINNQIDNQIDIFNFGINGATARVVHLLLGRILTPEELPKLIIWADGARAFNSGREDLTYEAIATSPGYQQLNLGRFPGSPAPEQEKWQFSLARLNQDIRMGYQSFNDWFGDALGEFSGVYADRDRLKEALSVQFTARIPSVEDLHLDLWDTTPSVSAREPINADGFLPLSVRFDPETYYLSHPKVAGLHDRDYSSFEISGNQYNALSQLISYLDRQQVNVIFVNLPLTKDYLEDPIRSQYEDEFQERMQGAAKTYNFKFLDLARRWQTNYEYFSDPSHLNRYGAYQVSVFLARSLMEN
ncbi:MAG: hypothetical protein J7647_25320 [Cyanobacteria bacterium SBLK]|nr:hypothetical protein [Cyanobacteria bacterium SBLK]